MRLHGSLRSSNGLQLHRHSRPLCLRQSAKDRAVVPSVRAQAMRRATSAFIPRNHRVEEALSAAVERGDYAPFETLLNILAHPFDDQPEFAAFAEPAPEGRGCYRTFCGT